MSKVQVDKVVNLSDDGAPQLTYGAELPVGYGLTGAGGLNITGVVTAASAVFSGNVTIGGTLTYEDVTNIDALGIVTARAGVNVSGGELLVGSNIKLGNAGVVTATSFVGSGANLTGVASTDYIITGTAATFNNKVNVNSTLTASEGINVSAGIVTIADGATVNSTLTASEGINVTAGVTTIGSSLLVSGGFAINSGTVTIPDKINHDGDTNTAIRFPAADTFTVETAGSERFRIADDGFIGIGTNGYGNLDPGVPLEIGRYVPTTAITDHNSLKSASMLCLHSSNNVNNSRSALMFTGALHPTDGCSAGIVANHENVSENSEATSLSFYTTASETLGERIRIADDGDVGVGTASPSARLHIFTASGSGGIQYGTASYNNYIYGIESNDNLANGTLAGELGIRGQNGVAISGNNGTACQVHINSNGLCLGGTGAANGLDDYEQGTFTPTLSYTSGASGVTYSAQQGRYTKIGDTCIFQLRVNLTDMGTSSGGNVQFGGLPFTPSTHTITNSMVQFDAVTGVNAGDDGKMPFCQVQSGNLVAYWMDYGGSGGYTELNIGNLSDTSQIAVSGEFKVGNP